MNEDQDKPVLRLVGKDEEPPLPPPPFLPRPAVAFILLVRMAEAVCLSCEEYPELVEGLDVDYYKRNVAVAVLKVMAL